MEELTWRKGSFPKSCAMAEFHQRALPRCTWLSCSLAGPSFVLTQPLLVHRHGLGVQSQQTATVLLQAELC